MLGNYTEGNTMNSTQIFYVFLSNHYVIKLEFAKIDF